MNTFDVTVDMVEDYPERFSNLYGRMIYSSNEETSFTRPIDTMVLEGAMPPGVFYNPDTNGFSGTPTPWNSLTEEERRGVKSYADGIATWEFKFLRTYLNYKSDVDGNAYLSWFSGIWAVRWYKIAVKLSSNVEGEDYGYGDVEGDCPEPALWNDKRDSVIESLKDQGIPNVTPSL